MVPIKAKVVPRKAGIPHHLFRNAAIKTTIDIEYTRKEITLPKFV
jgi:hypothetical protein